MQRKMDPSLCTSLLVLPESCIRPFAFELPLMVKGIIAVIPQPHCSVQYLKKKMSTVSRLTTHSMRKNLRNDLFLSEEQTGGFLNIYSVLNEQKRGEKEVMHIQVCTMRIDFSKGKVTPPSLNTS